MKEFEKWWNNQEVSKYNSGAITAYEDAWKAALEWVLSEKGHMTSEWDHDSLDTRIIYEELKGDS